MRKIRILFADDEPVIIRGLRRLLPWNEMGFEIVGEAYDGNELKRMLDVCRPDVVISDINMPGLTGIDIIREINETGRQIKVVFISAYQEFSYAQDAVKYGAIDYLLKPVDKERLHEVMRKVTRLIGEQSERNREKEMVVRFERQKRNNTIEEMLAGLTDEDSSAMPELKKFGVIHGSRFISVCYCELDKWDWQEEKRWKEQEKRLIDFSIANILVESLDHSDIGIYFRKGRFHGIFIQHDEPVEAIELANELHSKINEYLKVSVTIGLGEPVDYPDLAIQSAQSAEFALQARYFEGSNRVIKARQATQTDAEAKAELETLQQRMLASMTSGDAEELNRLFRDYIQAVRLFVQYNRNLAITSVYGCIVYLMKEMNELGISVNKADPDNHGLLEQLSSFPTFEMMTRFVERTVCDLRVQATERHSSKDVLQLVQVRAYIDEHYGENITLDSMASLVYMNPYYFSSFFKKHMGENFKQYLTEVRMKHALRLLLQSELMVYEIAERVGYQNARQFSDMFKKKYGKLPQEYKQSFKGS
ncbi:response regulator [Paenibacillus sp. JDR-2]|uniref:response regulator n=1 Tax=Paenibacillus sp. (strain JDR-2) TaxID=324057 RepID=UPI000166A65B|nr:response regulator [Paenibacillus sp. JDR-2]ACT00647.1 two component transcriptional regulator, AraC family [Paenibacillus sp. JDR-2]